MNRLGLLVLGVLFLSLAACERTSKPIGGKTQSSEIKIAMTDDVMHPELSAVSSIAGIADVLPKNAGDVVLDGKALFATHCSACHQVSGQGLPGVFPPLVDSPYVTSDNVDRLASIMIYGLMGPIKVKGVDYNSVMAGLGPVMTDAELSAIASYIRSSWGHSAAPVAAEVFKKSRDTHGARGPFNINDLGAEE